MGAEWEMEMGRVEEELRVSGEVGFIMILDGYSLPLGAEDDGGGMEYNHRDTSRQEMSWTSAPSIQPDHS